MLHFAVTLLVVLGSVLADDEQVTLSDSQKQTIVNSINDVRREAGIPESNDLSWSDDLAAQAAAEGTNCAFPTEAGRTAAARYPQDNNIDYLIMYSIGAMWKGQKRTADVLGSFDCGTKSRDHPYFCGDYTQLVWKNSQSVGCTVRHCGNNFILCVFDPPGNVAGEQPY